MSSPTTEITSPSSPAGFAITQSIAFFCFLVVPTLITLMVPFTRLELKHADSGPTATVTRYLLTFIPWKTERVDSVTQLRANITKERRYRGTREERRKGQKGVRLATGQLASDLRKLGVNPKNQVRLQIPEFRAISVRLPRTQYGGELRKAVTQFLEELNSQRLVHPCHPEKKLKFRLGQRAELQLRMHVTL